MAKKYC